MADPVHRAFGLSCTPHKADSFVWEETIVTGSPEFVSYNQGESQAAYRSDGVAAYTIHRHGAGAIHSFGFYYGYTYGSLEHLPVAREYKKENHYPLTVIARTPVEKLLAENGSSLRRTRGVEWIAFAHGTLVINHTPYTVEVPPAESTLSTFEGFNGRHLPGRHAVFLKQD